MAEVKLAVAASHFGYAFPAQVFTVIKSNLKPGERFFLLSTTGDPEVQKQTLEDALRRVHPTALIGISVRPDPDTVAAYVAARVPVVLIDEEVPGASLIATDNYLGGYLAGEHLIGKGRRNLAIVAGRRKAATGDYNSIQRIKGFTKALSEKGLELPQANLIEVQNYSHDDGIAAMAKILDQGTGIDAVFCAAGDVCATGLLATAEERRVRVPGDVAVVGYDDMEIAKISNPPLTTVRQPIKEMADTAYRLAVVEWAEVVEKPKKVLNRPELIVRNST